MGTRDATAQTDGHAASSEAGLVEWRENLLTAYLWILSSAYAWALGFGSYQDLFSWSQNLWAAITVTALVAAVSRRMYAPVRLAVMLGGLLVVVSLALAEHGFQPNTFVALSVGVVAAGLLSGRRAGLLFLGLGAACIAGVLVLHRASVLTLEPDWYAAMDFRNPGVTLRVTVLFGFLAGGLMLSVRYVLDRTEALLATAAVANTELHREQIERERVQQDLADREMAFRKASELELLGRLAGYAAHDFNNALMVIQGNAELAKSFAADAGVLRALEEIMDASHQAADTARQLRSFGPQPANDGHPISLAQGTERVSRLLQALLPSNVEISLVLESDGVIAIEEGELQRVVTNLSLNARDAMREGGRLQLRVFSPTPAELPKALGAAGGYVALEVQDTGHGMDAATQERIFDPYFTTKGDAGTGLGLASVRELVRARGGDVTVDSQLGHGTRLVVYWSRADAISAPVAAIPSRARATGTVLVVDDNIAVRRVITMTLEDSGLRVLQAGTGDEALEAARVHATPIDLMLTDASMPGMPLRQLVAQFRDLFPQAGVILCSGYAPDGVVRDPAEFDAILTKPVEPQALASAVSGLLDERRASSG